MHYMLLQLRVIFRAISEATHIKSCYSENLNLEQFKLSSWKPKIQLLFANRSNLETFSRMPGWYFLCVFIKQVLIDAVNTKLIAAQSGACCCLVLRPTGPSVEPLSLGTMLELATNFGVGQWSANNLEPTWTMKCLKVRDALQSINWQLFCCMLAEPRAGANLQSKRICLSATCHWHVCTAQYGSQQVWIFHQSVACQSIHLG